MATEIGRGVIPVTFDKDAIAKDLQSSALPAFQRLATDAAALFVGKKLFDIGKAGLEELKEAGVVAAQTAAAIKSTGGAAGVTAEEIDGLASSLSAMSGKDDEAIASAENLLLTFTNIKNTDTAKTFDAATAAALDLSVAFGKDLQSSAILVGKALNDPATGLTALQKVGVAFTAEQKNVIQSLVDTGDVAGAQAVILEELNRQVGGSAEAYGKTLAGSMEKAQTAMDNAKGAMVGGLAPAIQIGADLAVKMAEGFTSLPEPLQQVAGGVALVGGGILSLARPVNDTIALFSRFKGVQEATAVATEVATVAQAEQAVVQNSAASVANLYAGAQLKAKAASTGFAAALGPIGIGLAALAVGYTIASQQSSQAEDDMKDLGKAVDQLGDKFTDLSKDTSGALKKFFAEQAKSNETFVDDLRLAGATTAEFSTAILGGGESLEAFRDSLHGSGDEGTAAAIRFAEVADKVQDAAQAALEAATTNDGLNSAQRAAAQSALEAGTASGNYAGELDTLQENLGGIVTETGEFVDTSTAAASAMEASRIAAQHWLDQGEQLRDLQGELADAIDGVASALDAAYNRTVDPVKLNADFEAAVDSLTASLAKNGIVLDKNTGLLADDTEAQRDALAATLDVGEKIVDVIEARFDETHSLIEARQAGIDYVENLKDQLREAGLNETAIAALIDTMNLTPEDIATTFSNNVPEVQALIADLEEQIKGLPTEQQTEFQALIDAGSYGEVEAALDALEAARTVDFFADYQGPTGSILGGPEPFAEGGTAYGGQVIEAAERGYEIAVLPTRGLYQMPPTGAQIIPHAESEQFFAGLGGQGGGGFTFNAGGIVVQGTDARDALEELPDVTRAMMHLLVPA